MARMTTMRTPVEEALFAQISQFAANENKTIAAKRRQAFQALQELGLPHRRVEEWKYTDLRSFWREPLPVAAKPGKQELDEAGALAGLPIADAARLTFVNGYLVGSGDLPPGVEVVALETVLAGQHMLQSKIGAMLEGWNNAAIVLNAAFLRAGAVVRIGKSLKQPLHLDMRFSGAPSACYPRIVVMLEDGVEAELVQTLHSASRNYVCNAVIEVECGAGAQLTHTYVQQQSDQVLQLTSIAARLGRDSVCNLFAFENGAALARTQLFLRQVETDAQVNLFGVSLIKGKQHCDTTLVMDHAAPSGVSRELFKQVIADEGHGVFQGKVIVRPDAQKTDGQMQARGLLLGENAEFDAKPELEIYADDVLCAHGATAGALDENLLFYLRARGLPEGVAKAMLVTAFVGEALEKIPNEALRASLMQRAELWLKENLH